ncbi:MAG: TRAP transporter large permease subunit [Gammaproteobacteria bacterium]|jgi:tripartite ATP-independent transporter DctM subunit|nr:TRAP transporter large permease subunit [Gammaproteobacteria bacterium]MBT7603612.1 TRAP transporter large permease subunit [Gammaproteobacteria bacterium]
MLSILLFLLVIFILMLGYPVAFTLSGVSLIFALLCSFTNNFDLSLLYALPSRIFGIITNETLLAIPMFIFMGIMLEKSKIAENLLESMSSLFQKINGGLGISVIIVGALLAASTGIVGATVVTMGLLSLPTMLKQNYDVKVATGTILASGTLGQIIPPSIILILLGDVISSSYQEAQNMLGIFSQESVSVGDLFAGAIFPGLILVGFYILYILFLSTFRKDLIPKKKLQLHLRFKIILLSLIAPLFLILAVLGSIIMGLATPTEASSVGAIGAIILAGTNRKLNLDILKGVLVQASKITSMIFILLIGATIFSLVFRGLEGDVFVHDILTSLPGGVYSKLFFVMMIIFFLGFILDFIEITYVVIPVVAPILLAMGVNPIWLGILIAINLQTSFLTPPFGFAIFYLKSVIPKNIKTVDIYRGVIPFIIIQLITILIIVLIPETTTWLPNKIFG